MKSLTKSFLILLIALSMLISSATLLSGCQSYDDPQDDLPGEENGETDKLAYLPDEKFNEDFIVICRDNGEEFLRETAEGDRVDYAIYMRNRTVEDRYGIEIKQKMMAYNLIPGWVSDILKANDQKSMDIVNNHVVYSSRIPLAGNAMNLMDVPHIDLTGEWWEPSTLKDLTLNNIAYIAIGDMCTSSISATYCVYYNKELCEKYHLPDMYELAIEKGEWTYSTMMELISEIREDLNHDKKYDDEDLFGLITSGGSFINAYIWAFDNPIFSTNPNTGEPEFVFLSNGNKISRIFTNLIKMHRKTNGVYMGYYTDEMFVDDKAIFYNSTFGSAVSSLRDMEAEKWGIIPYPKYNAKQTKYITAVDGGHNAIVIPRTTNERKLEKIGVVTEALNCLSQNVVTEYYDKGLKSKYLGDPREAKAIDLIMSNRVFDFGYIYLEFKSPAFWLQDMIPSGDDDIVAKYGIKRGELENIIEDAFEAFGLSFSGLA